MTAAQIHSFNEQKLKDFRFCESKDETATGTRVVKKTKWIISIARNFLVIVICSVIAYCLIDVYGMDDVFYITGEVQSGLPEFLLPWTRNNGNGNSTTDVIHEGPLEIAEELGIGLVMLPLVVNLQHLANVKHYTRKVSLLY